jgi:hypothetical protein
LGLIGRLFPQFSSLGLLIFGSLFTSLTLALILILLAARIFQETADRVICFLILSLGSGLGWLHLVPDPPDLRIVETSTFLTFLSPLLYQTSVSLLLAIFLCIDRSWNAQNRRAALRWSGLAGFCGLWLALERPFSLAPAVVAITGAVLIRSIKDPKNRFPLLLRTLPLITGIAVGLFYQWILIRTIPVYAAWNRQHVLPTPEPHRMLAALGLLLPFGIAGVNPLQKRAPVLGYLFLIYIPASLLFSYLPFPYQERFLEGLPVSVALFASAGLVRLLSNIQHTNLRTAIAAITIVLLTPSSFVGLRSDLESLAHQSPPQYLPQRLIEDMKRLAQFAAPDEAILSSQAIGNFIPAYAARPVVIGHNVATANVQEKRALVTRLFRTKANTPDAKKLFEFSRARWLFWSPEEKAIARGKFDPAEAPYLKLQFSDSLANIYHFKPN